ncbi:MAG: GntR family transcriptional regulator [Acidobacteriota bacterium]
MLLKIDSASSASVYRQICDQVKYAVATGALLPGDRLPPIREVASANRVNRNTVARAYSELERDGVIIARRGQGSFVAARSTSIKTRERLRFIEDMIRKLLVEAYHLELTSSELHELIERVESSFNAGRSTEADAPGKRPADDGKEKRP